jgi:hypothetical protein
MSNRLERQLEKECCTLRSLDDRKQSREGLMSPDCSSGVRAPLIVVPSNLVHVWSERYRFTANSLN